jgi:hypothetical protein
MTMGARARADGGDAEVPPRHVEVKLVASSDDGGLEAALGELLGRLQVSVHFARIASIDTRQIMADHEGEAPAVARVWVDLREPSRVTLYLAGNKADRLLVRHVPLVDRIDEVAREEIAHIVEATVDALLVGGRLGVVTDESAVPKTPAPAFERPPKGVSLDVGLGYAAQAWSASSQPFLHGPAVFVGMVGRAGSLRPGVWMSGELRFPTTIEGDPISTRLDQGAVRALGIADWAVSRRWVLRAGLGGGVDWVHIAPESKDGSKVDLQPAHFATVPMLRLLASARYLFTTKSELFAGVAADFDCFNTRYLVQRESGDDVVFHPWRLRPMAVLGVASDVLGR